MERVSWRNLASARGNGVAFEDMDVLYGIILRMFSLTSKRGMRGWIGYNILVGQILYVILETASIDETPFLFMTEQWIPLDSVWYQRRSCTS